MTSQKLYVQYTYQAMYARNGIIVQGIGNSKETLQEEENKKRTKEPENVISTHFQK